jgi:hypothetical protein
MAPTTSELCLLSKSPRDLRRVDAAFPDYNKLRSIAWLLSLGARTTEGVVVTEASEQAVEDTATYARSRGWDQFMLRHDSPSGRPRTVQGGFLIQFDEIQSWAQRFTDGGVCLLLEPLNPLRNGYNISCLIEESSALIEISGPGFDASDLQRGQIKPHEIRTFDTTLGRFDVPSIVDQPAYEASIAERKRKIWWKLHERELIPKRWRRLDAAESEACEQLILEARGGNIPPRYEPISSSMLDRYAELARPIVTAWRREHGELPAVLSGSFVQDGSFCFWDVNTSRRWLG